MPFGIAWKGPTTPEEVLQLQSPSGYAWKPSNACIWRFVARGAGKVNLIFRALPSKMKFTLPAPLATKRQMHALLGFQAYPEGDCSCNTSSGVDRKSVVEGEDGGRR